MKNAVSLAVLGFVVAFGLILRAGEKPPDKFVRAMKDMAVAAQGVGQSNTAMEFGAVRKHAQSIKNALAVVDEYWDTLKNASATGLTKAAIKAAADMDTAAAVEESEGVTFAMTELQQACAECHAAHREQAPDGSYEIK